MAIKQKFTTDTADLDKAYGKLERENTKLLEQNRRLAQQTRAGGRAHRDAFGDRAVASLRSYATNVLSITAVVGTLANAWRRAEAAQKAAAESQKTSRPGLAELGQLAETPEEMLALTRRATEFYGLGGFESKGEAGQLIFALESAGVPVDQQKLFAELKSAKEVQEPAEMAKATKTLVATMGQEETGTFRDLVSKAFGASKFSPARAEEILEAAARSGVSAGAMGVSDEEVLAATALMAEARGSAEMGGTYLAQMFRTLKGKAAFKGQTLEETIGHVEKMRLGGEDLGEFFGTKDLERRMAEMREGLTVEEAGGFLRKQRQQIAEKQEAVKKGRLTEEEYQQWYGETVVAEVAQKGMTPGQFKEWFGRAQGQESFETLAKQIDRLRMVTAEVAKAQAEDRVATKLALPDVAGELRHARLAEREAAREEIAMTRMGQAENLFQAALAQERTRQRAEGWSEGLVQEASWRMEKTRAVTGPEFMLREAVESGRLQPGLQKEIEDFLTGAKIEKQAGVAPLAGLEEKERAGAMELQRIEQQLAALRFQQTHAQRIGSPFAPLWDPLIRRAETKAETERQTVVDYLHRERARMEPPAEPRPAPLARVQPEPRVHPGEGPPIDHAALERLNQNIEQGNKIAQQQLDRLVEMDRRDARRPPAKAPRGAAQAQLDAQAEP